MNPYIGDRQLDPDEEYECPHCGCFHTNEFAHAAHIKRCAQNDDIDLPSDWEDLQ